MKHIPRIAPPSPGRMMSKYKSREINQGLNHSLTDEGVDATMVELFSRDDIMCTGTIL